MPLKPADVFLNQIDPRRGDVERRVLGESQREIFLALAVLGDRLHACELGDAVRNVNDVVAGLEIEERIDGTGSDDSSDAPSLLVAVEELVVAEEGNGKRRSDGATKRRRGRWRVS